MNYWSVGLVGVKVGDKPLPISTNVAIVDTGTSYLLMPACNYYYFYILIEDFEAFTKFF